MKIIPDIFRKVMARAKNDAGERIESLRFSVPALRVGVLEYGAGQLQTGNSELEGKPVKLYYPPEAVSDEKFLKSLETAPVVVGGHDSTTNEQNKKIDGWAHNVFFDKSLNAAMIAGVVKGAKEVAYIKGNLGTSGFGASAFVDIYNLKVEHGVTPDGQEYNAIANDLRATHVALAPHVRDPENKIKVTNAVCVKNTGEMTEVENSYVEDSWLRDITRRISELKSDDDRRGLTAWLHDWERAPENSSTRLEAAKRIEAQYKKIINVKNAGDEMELSDEHIKAMVKNMAAEMVEEMRAANVKNAGNHLQELIKLTNEEKARLTKIANTTQGAQRLLEIFEKQFSRKTNSVNDAIAEIARVNALRSQRNEVKLI